MGKVNGAGGKLEAGETLKACAIRELAEETGLIIRDAHCRAELRFVDQKGPQWLGYVFVTDSWSGNLEQTNEADPFWVEVDQIPYNQMWPDDAIWLPKFLRSNSDPFGIYGSLDRQAGESFFATSRRGCCVWRRGKKSDSDGWLK